MFCPATIDELASALRDASSQRQTITLAGHNTKRLMAGPIEPSDVTISTTRLNRILQYEPRDLTISVEAGLPYRDLSQALAANRQMVPLDPGFHDECTIGGVIAANISGPRRRLYGTARDMVIGMKFVTVEGKAVQSGGMVVKNVAGLDMAKMMIGSFGTLAAIAVINFRLHPIPPLTKTFVLAFPTLAEAMATCDAIHRGVLQPAALDIVKQNSRYRLLIQAGGNQAVSERYTRELKTAEAFEGVDEEKLWTEIREFTPAFLKTNPDGAVIRISCALSEVGGVLESLPSTALARAGSGVVYGYFDNWREALGCGVNKYAAILEYGPDAAREQNDSPLAGRSDFAMMKKTKDMFDPQSLLNRRRLYGLL
jgi:glycolate oxidase FAD binding subunit